METHEGLSGGCLSTVTSSGRLFLMIAAALGFTGVAAGAFGAHGLKKVLEPDLLAVFETGVRYQMYHAFALMAVAWLSTVRQESTSPGIAGWLFVAGILVFSGSLYILALTGIRAFGAVTPVGGMALLGGWLVLFFAAFKNNPA